VNWFEAHPPAVSDSSTDAPSSTTASEEDNSDDAGEDRPLSTEGGPPLHNAYAALRAMLGSDRADGPNE